MAEVITGLSRYCLGCTQSVLQERANSARLGIMAVGTMLRLTPDDSSVMTALAQPTALSDERKQQLLDELQSPESRQLGEAFLDPQKYAAAPEYIRNTVDYFREWVENNRRLRRQREALRRVSRG